MAERAIAAGVPFAWVAADAVYGTGEYLPTPDRWTFVHTSGEEIAVTPKGPLRANNGDALTPALRAGLGLAIQPEFMVWEDLAAGRSEAVMHDWSLPEIALNLVTPPGGLRPARVSVLSEYLTRTLSAAPWAAAAEDSAEDHT